MYESFVESPIGATEPAAEEAIDLVQVLGLVQHFQGVQGQVREVQVKEVQGQDRGLQVEGVQGQVDPQGDVGARKGPGVGAAHAPLPMSVRQQRNPTDPPHEVRHQSAAAAVFLDCTTHHSASSRELCPPYEP